MSAIYDNWERLVAAVLKKEQIRQLCYADSIATSVGSLAYTSILSPSVPNADVSVSSQILGSISQSYSSVVMYDGVQGQSGLEAELVTSFLFLSHGLWSETSSGKKFIHGGLVFTVKIFVIIWKYLAICTNTSTMNAFFSNFNIKLRWGLFLYNLFRIWGLSLRLASGLTNYRTGSDGVTTVVKRLRGSDIRHETVAPCDDSYFSYEDEMLVIYEHQSLGGASTLPHGKKHGIYQLNWEPRVRIAIAVAKAIANNHESLPMDGMLSGIDLEKMEAASSSIVIPTAGYRAPVVMKYERHPSDVYSFGVLLLELLMGDKLVIRREGLVRWAIRMFHEVGTLIVFEFARVRDSNKLIDMWKMFLVAMRCVEGKPEMRPEMSDVLKMMQGIKT